MTSEDDGTKRRRKLVVVFDVLADDMVQDEQNDRPQLVHTRWTHPVEKPSLVGRLLIRLKVKKAPHSKVDEAVAEVHRFISDNYQSGDDVILAAYENSFYPQGLQATRLLATHLSAGALPQDATTPQSGGVGGDTNSRIPIHCVIVDSLASHESICSWNDELKSGLPPGIEHIICSAYCAGSQGSCSTRFDANGALLEREVCLYEGGYRDQVFKQATKHVIYYEPDWIPKWDQDEPVWTHVPRKPPSEALDTPFLETVGSVGMYRYELRKYKGVKGDPDNPLRLVWKATRNQSAVHYYTPSPL